MCLALLLGPLGPGGAWHVARADVVRSQLGSPAMGGQTSAHAAHPSGSCLTCHLMQAARAVLPATAVLASATPTGTQLTVGPIQGISAEGPAAAPSRAPPLS